MAIDSSYIFSNTTLFQPVFVSARLGYSDIAIKRFFYKDILLISVFLMSINISKMFVLLRASWCIFSIMIAEIIVVSCYVDVMLI